MICPTACAQGAFNGVVGDDEVLLVLQVFANNKHHEQLHTIKGVCVADKLISKNGLTLKTIERELL